MFDTLTVRTSDLAASERFYGLVLGTLGLEPTAGEDGRREWRDFAIAQAGEPAATTRGVHLGFVAPTREHVDAFWRAGTEAGHRDDGAPGPRRQYREDYYGAFLLDPDGNSAEAVHHGALRREGALDHVWMRVRSLAAARAFYARIAPFGGFELAAVHEERVRFAAGAPGGGSLTLVAGEPTRNVHLAFAVRDSAVLEASRASLPAAGARVLDPDGNSIELVIRSR
jgi:catechol 2,3-dioxygenase-like lactoylglutathione lyase family enzyme